MAKLTQAGTLVPRKELREEGHGSREGEKILLAMLRGLEAINRAAEGW